MKIGLEKTVWTPANGTRNRALTMTMQPGGSGSRNIVQLRQEYNQFLDHLKQEIPLEYK